MEVKSNKNELKSLFRGTKAAWNKFLKPAVNATAPVIVNALAAN